MLKLVLRGNMWHLRGCVRGVTIRETTGLRREQVDEADLHRLKREAELIVAARAPGAAGPSVRAMTGAKTYRSMAAACADYLGRPEGVRYNDRLTVEKIRETLGTLAVTSVTPANVAAFAAEYRGQAAASVRRRLIVLRAILNREKRMGYLAAVPHFEMPPDSEPRDRALTVVERDALLAACSGDLEFMRPLVAFLLYTGARLGEAVTALPEQFGPAGVVLTTRKGKKMRKRMVPLHAGLLAIMPVGVDGPGVRWVAGQPVFRSVSGERWGYSDGLSAVRSGWTSPVHAYFKEACRRAGIVDFTPHDCRHTFATLIAEKGGDLDEIAKLLGHTSTKMAERYKHKRPSRMVALVDAL